MYSWVAATAVHVRSLNQIKGPYVLVGSCNSYLVRSLNQRQGAYILVGSCNSHQYPVPLNERQGALVLVGSWCSSLNQRQGAYVLVGSGCSSLNQRKGENILVSNCSSYPRLIPKSERQDAYVLVESCNRYPLPFCMHGQFYKLHYSFLSIFLSVSLPVYGLNILGLKLLQPLCLVLLVDDGGNRTPAESLAATLNQISHCRPRPYQWSGSRSMGSTWTRPTSSPTQTVSLPGCCAAQSAVSPKLLSHTGFRVLHD
jgi:hypothetical protein